jgi:phosphoglycerol transferase MdoB-like AlkP superfamily enzyme
MRKVFIIIAVVFAIISIVFTFLPLGTLAIIPIIPTLLFGFLAFRGAEGKQWHAARLLLIIGGLTLLIVIGKEIFIKDEVIADKQFEAKKIESEKETKKELEELEGLE